MRGTAFIRPAVVTGCAFAVGFFLADRFFAARAALDAGAALDATTRPTASTQPAVSPAPATSSVVPDFVRRRLDDSRAAYRPPFVVTGTLRVQLDAGGTQRDDTRTFRTTYESTARFRHEVEGELVLIGDGQAHHFHSLADAAFATWSARQQTGPLPGEVRQLLLGQNPALLIAAGALLDDPLLATPQWNQTADTLRVDCTDGRSLRLSFDASGRLIESQIDHRTVLLQRGVSRVEQALVTIRYDTYQGTSEVDAGLFTFSPPPGAADRSAPVGPTTRELLQD